MRETHDPGDVSGLRPYVLTGGRVTAEGVAFDMLVAVTPGTAVRPRTREGREVLRALGDSYLTVAEVAARLRLPLGTTQVLVADLSAAGVVRLFGAWSAGQDPTDGHHHTLALLGSVIDGIGEL